MIPPVKKIFEVAEALNYSKFKRPAAGPGGRRIAVVQWYSENKEMDDLYYMAIRMGIEKRSQELQIQTTPVFQNQVSEITPDMDGIIAVGKYSDAQVAELGKLTDNLVFVDWNELDKGYDSVVTEFKRPVAEVVNELNGDREPVGIISGSELTTDKKNADSRSKIAGL